MILRPSEQSLLVVAQADHARLAGELLALFRLPELVSHPRRAELLFAVREHDNGWWEADAAPRVDPASGAPVDFLHVTDAQRREIWKRAVERHAREHPCAAALVATHALRLFATRRGDGQWEEFLGALDERRAELLATGSVSLTEIAADDAWLELADDLSLAACEARGDRVRTLGFSARTREPGDGSVEVALAPFPLVGATRFEVPCRSIPVRRYENGIELGSALASARWTILSVRLMPG